MREEGILNSAINNLPFELHLPGYNYCGPGTKLRKRLSRGDKGVNPLDDACMHHDIAYSRFPSLIDRHNADLELLNMAKKRTKSKTAGTGEKIASWLVSKVMKAKLKAGGSLKGFHTMVSNIKSRLKKHKPKNNKSLIKMAYTIAKRMIKNKNVKVRVPRIIPVPKTGGILPLIPIFAGLSALGALAGGAAGIAKTVNEYKSAQKNLQESQRHNKMMESIAIGKGLYIKPHKKGKGLYLSPPKN